MTFLDLTQCLGGAYAFVAGHSGVAAVCGGSSCCCCLGCGLFLKRVVRLLTEPHVGEPKLARRRAKARALPGAPPPGAAPAWPCKGGDAGRSGAPGISATRSLEEPAWSYFLDAVTYSTNVIDAAGNVYVNASSGLVLSLDPSGGERWRYMCKGYSPPCPALLDGVLFTADCYGSGYALQASTGKEIWVRKISQGAGMDCWAVAAADGVVIYQTNATAKKDMGVDWTQYGDIFGVDPASGEERWRYRVDALMYNVMPTIASGRVFFTDGDAGLYCLEAKKGQEVWKLPGYKWDFPLSETKTPCPRCLCSIAIFREERVYMTGNPTKTTGIARAHSAEKGDLLWSRDFDQHMGNAAALSDACGVLTLVFGVGTTAPLGTMLKIDGCPPYLGAVYGLNAANGDVIWRCEAPPVKLETYFKLCPGQKLLSFWPRLNLPDSFSMPAIGGDGTVYIGWQGGFVLAIDGATGKLLSSYECKEGIQAEPTIGPGKELVIATGTHLHCFAD